MSYLRQLLSEDDKYKKLLASSMSNATTTSPLHLQLSAMSESKSFAENTKIYPIPARGKLLLVRQNPDEAELEEATVSVQGYVVQLDLPPLRQDQVKANTPLLRLNQHITLSGLGVESFDKAAQGMKLIHQSFLNYLDGKRLRDWKVKTDGETLLLSFNNRLLTLAKDVHGEDILDMSSIDPLQLLQNRIQTEVHTSENVVEYWEKGKESSSFTHISSQAIRPGHLVEVQASFEAIKLKSDEYVLLAKLRSICILDRVVEHDYNQAIIKTIRSKPISPLKKVKRRIGYQNGTGDSEVTESEQQLKKLRISEDLHGQPGSSSMA